MPYLFKLAFRNVFRNKRRSLLTLGCIASGVCAILIIGGYYECNYYGLRESLIKSHYAHIQLYQKGYLGNEEAEPFISMIRNYQEIIAFLERDPRVMVATPRLNVWGVLNKMDGTSEVVQIRGIVPDKEKLINLFITKRVGNELDGKSLDKMELGYSLAENLGLRLNDEAILTTITADGAQNAWQLSVGGMTGSYSAEMDSVLVKIPLTIAQELVAVSGVQQIVVLLTDTSLTNTYKQELETAVRAHGWDLDITSWYDLSGYYRQVVEYYGGYFRIILFITSLITFFTTLNTIMMSVFEKMTELGTMRSFGHTKTMIVKLLFGEGLLLGVLGAACGIILAYLLAYIIDVAGGIYVSPPPGVVVGFYARILITWPDLILAVLLALAVPMLAALVPALRAGKLQIIEQINYNDRG